MERKIKFRGKRIDNGEWVYGYLYRLSEKLNPFIMLIDRRGESYEVDPKTVGQYTGQKDKNGEELYDGDICNCREYECCGKIEWSEDEAGFYFCVFYEDGMFEEEQLYDYVSELEIIGNIHDNPELLEV